MALHKYRTDRKSSTKHIGDIGEQIAAAYLIKRGFRVIETNYRKDWGELDIVAQNKHIIHFVEVKTHSFESKDVLHKGLVGDNWRPEEQVHQFKLHQIEKTLETWLSERQWEGEWQIDVVAVRVVPREQYATVNHIQNIVV